MLIAFHFESPFNFRLTVHQTLQVTNYKIVTSNGTIITKLSYFIVLINSLLDNFMCDPVLSPTYEVVYP